MYLSLVIVYQNILWENNYKYITLEANISDYVIISIRLPWYDLIMIIDRDMDRLQAIHCSRTYGYLIFSFSFRSAFFFNVLFIYFTFMFFSCMFQFVFIQILGKSWIIFLCNEFPWKSSISIYFTFFCRVCMDQTTLSEGNISSWMVNSFTVLPHLPSHPTKYFQVSCFSLLSAQSVLKDVLFMIIITQ